MGRVSRFGVASCIVGALTTAACERTALAQPLVTGDLTIYYDFDENVGGQFLDESGNGFHGTIVEDGPGTLIVDTVDPQRGPGSAVFQQSGNPSNIPVFVDVGGEDITRHFPEKLPTSAITIAAWLKVTANMGTDQSVFQARSGDGAFGVIFQVQGDGRLRMTFRGQTNNTIVSALHYTDGSDDNTDAVYPVGEWFHYAGTYDADSNTWAMYFDGQPIASGSGTGLHIGDWGGRVPPDFFAAGVGAIYDGGHRNLDGSMDELYVFHRALVAQEIETLFLPEPASPWLAVWALGSLCAARRWTGSGQRKRSQCIRRPYTPSETARPLPSKGPPWLMETEAFRSGHALIKTG